MSVTRRRSRTWQFVSRNIVRTEAGYRSDRNFQKIGINNGRDYRRPQW